MSEDKTGPRWEEEAPPERLGRLAAAVTATLADHPEGGEDIKAIVVLTDGQGASAAGMAGYGAHPLAYQLADFVKHAGNLFAASGVRMTVRVGDELAEQYHSPLEHSDEDQPEAELSIVGVAPTAAMKRASEIVTRALEAEKTLDGTRIVIIMGLTDEASVLLHHGYGGNTHAVVHTLMAALMQADQGGSHVVAIPMGGHPN
jgi:hypothetical protein